jgi:outer membrane receptor protein involved in Fe transport
MRILLSGALALFSFLAVAQTGTITGKLIDSETKEPLIGATVLVEGTTLGGISDLDGKYIIKNVKVGNVSVRVKYIGYEDVVQQVTVTEGQTTTVPDITLQSTTIGLSEVEVFANIVEDRKTPVAASTIGLTEISEQLGAMQLPELLNETPGIYATQGDGSFGDSYVNIRGFGQEEVLFLINGVPTNDMETGIMYWSNFAGLSEVTRSMQVQRGLGASKLAVNSVGGTINIITNPSEKRKGGQAEVTFGNGTYNNRYRLTLNSGQLKGGWAFTFQGARISGEGMRPGTFVDAWSYFLTASKQLSTNHTLLFTAFGAPATRGRAWNTNTARYEQLGSYLYNGALGYYKGKDYNISQNKSHKPQITLMSLWNINEKMTLTTSGYVSLARVYGTAPLRRSSGEVLDNDGLHDLDSVARINRDNVVTIQNPYGQEFGTSITGAQSKQIIEARYNNHNWYGVISSLNYQLDANTSIVAGVDLRDYRAAHYGQVHDLLGGNFWLDTDVRSNLDNNYLTPNRIARTGDKIRYDYDGVVRWGAAFSQLEKTINQFDIFVSANVSRIQMYRVGNFWSGDYEDNSLGKSDARVFNNYNVKAGVNYKISGRQNVFFNLGRFTRAPFMRNAFEDARYSNTFLRGLTNETVNAVEAGYSYRTSKFRAAVNAYYTQWRDKALVESFVDPQSGTEIYYSIVGQGAIHKGIEFNSRYDLFPGFEIRGMASFGNWEWTENINAVVTDNQGSVIGNVNVYTKGLKVGNAPQTTAFIGGHYKGIKDLYVGFRFNYFGDLYELYDPATRTSEGGQVRQLPDYTMLDVYGGYYFGFGGMRARAAFNIHNLLNQRFIRRSDEAFGVQELYGFPINFNASLTLYFND